MSPTAAADTELLDNLIWHALAGPHAHLAQADGPARRYHPDVAVFVAVEHTEPSAWAALRRLVGPGVVVALSGTLGEAAPPHWTRHGGGLGNQMVLRHPELLADPDPSVRIETLGVDDVPQMLALVELAKPGPFRPRTIEMGSYFGVFDDDRRLLGLAGERLRAPGFTEISAVSTHPSVRRRGLASQLTSHVARHIAARGDTPMLHVAGTNETAKRVYDRLGFEVRSQVRFVALETPQLDEAPR